MVNCKHAFAPPPAGFDFVGGAQQKNSGRSDVFLHLITEAGFLQGRRGLICFRPGFGYPDNRRFCLPNFFYWFMSVFPGRCSRFNNFPF